MTAPDPRPADKDVDSGVAGDRWDWARLNRLQLGRYAEYFVKMEFTLFGFDVYSAEVDDRGIDFVIRRGHDQYYDVQVKSIRERGYVFFEKAKFELRDNLLAALVLFISAKPPELYVIPSTSWRQPNTLFVGYDYELRKSKPEWGLNLSRRNLHLLRPFRFDSVAPSL